MSLLSKDKSRAELEDALEKRLHEHAKSLEGGDTKLKVAYDYQPAFFGGRFPASGLGITATRGPSASRDRPERPGFIEAQFFVFGVSMPMRGPRNAEEDREGMARRETRRIRGAFIERLFGDPEIGPFLEVSESRGGDTTDVGTPITDERGQQGNLLWLDRTDLVIRVP